MYDQKATQKAVDALIKAIGVSEENLSAIEVRCSGAIRVLTRDRAALGFRVEKFKTKEKP